MQNSDENISYFDIDGLWHIKPSALHLSYSKGKRPPIAIRLTIDPAGGLASWDDTIRSHTIRFVEYVLDAQELSLVSRDGSRWTFVPLTRDHLALHEGALVPFVRTFSSDQELRDYYTRGG
jgi:hypothetical protein